ncbi:hypothetical protein AGMMS50267_01080 [Spirochaetia bacterium]|nr:hypothetical protein AGMMS50267_01080 [Spirochaetia bacterium]
MGITYTEITLQNTGDIEKAEDGLINKKEVRQVTLQAMVDTGAGTLVITEAVCNQLGLRIQGVRTATVAGGGKTFCKVTHPVTIYWQDRYTACPALVVPGENNILLGAIPLEDLDLVVNPGKQIVEGAHGNEVLMTLK